MGVVTIAVLTLHLTKNKTSDNLWNCSLLFPKVSQRIYPRAVPCTNNWFICGHLLVWFFRWLISVLRHLVSLSLPLSFSALHHAALTGTTELLSLLLEAQATVDIQDINGKTADQIKQSQQTTRLWYLLLIIELFFPCFSFLTSQFLLKLNWFSRGDFAPFHTVFGFPNDWL